jgi:hypothetical protein
LTPAHWLAAGRHLLEKGGIAVRHACDLVELRRTSLRYVSRRSADENTLTQRLCVLAAARPAGPQWARVNHKRVAGERRGRPSSLVNPSSTVAWTS